MKKKFFEIVLLLFIVFQFIATYCLLSLNNYNMFVSKKHYYLVYKEGNLFGNGSLVKFDKTINCVDLKEGTEVYYILSPDVVLKGKIDARDENMDNDALIIDGNYVKCDKMLGSNYREYKNIGNIVNFLTNKSINDSPGMCKQNFWKDH